MPRERLQGALDLLILETLARGVAHGYGITRTGHKHLRQVEEEWRAHTAVIEDFLAFEESGSCCAGF